MSSLRSTWATLSRASWTQQSMLRSRRRCASGTDRKLVRLLHEDLQLPGGRRDQVCGASDGAAAPKWG
eukprot:960330-Prymnesium_polylepis.2